MLNHNHNLIRVIRIPVFNSHHAHCVMAKLDKVGGHYVGKSSKPVRIIGGDAVDWHENLYGYYPVVMAWFDANGITYNLFTHLTKDQTKGRELSTQQINRYLGLVVNQYGDKAPLSLNKVVVYQGLQAAGLLDVVQTAPAGVRTGFLGRVKNKCYGLVHDWIIMPVFKTQAYLFGKMLTALRNRKK